MVENKIDFPELDFEGTKVAVVLKEFQIIKIEKTQTVISSPTAHTYVDGNNNIQTSVSDHLQTKIKTTIYLDNNEHFSMDKDVPILEGWHIKESYLLFGERLCYHSTYCPEAKEVLLGSKDPIFSRLRRLRWHLQNRTQISEICILDEENKDSLKLPTTKLNFLLKEDSFFDKVIKGISGCGVFAAEMYFLIKYAGGGTAIFLMVFFSAILLGISFIVAMIISSLLRKIINHRRVKEYKELCKKEFILPDVYKDVETKMNKIIEDFYS